LIELTSVKKGAGSSIYLIFLGRFSLEDIYIRKTSAESHHGKSYTRMLQGIDVGSHNNEKPRNL
jgi:hypothetical protein